MLSREASELRADARESGRAPRLDGVPGRSPTPSSPPFMLPLLPGIRIPSSPPFILPLLPGIMLPLLPELGPTPDDFSAVFLPAALPAFAIAQLTARTPRTSSVCWPSEPSALKYRQVKVGERDRAVCCVAISRSRRPRHQAAPYAMPWHPERHRQMVEMAAS